MKGNEPLYDFVALLAEGVDRNCEAGRELPVESVALLAESVDRNFRAR